MDDARRVRAGQTAPGGEPAMAEVSVLPGSQREALVEATERVETFTSHCDVVGCEELRRNTSTTRLLVEELQETLGNLAARVIGRTVDGQSSEQCVGLEGVSALERDEPVRIGEAVIIDEREQPATSRRGAGVACRRRPGVELPSKSLIARA